MAKIGDFNLLKPIGKGSFGEVYLSSKDGTKEYFAVKKLKRKEIEKPSIMKYFQNEIQILKELNHPNICKLVDVKKSKDHYYIMMEYVNGGCLSDCLEKYQQKYNTSFSEEIVQYLMRQIIDAFKYIHENNIMHRDIKLPNIMINYSNENDKNSLNILKAKIKIIDFGMAIKGNIGRSLLGSPLTMDPLILKKYANCAASRVSKEEVYDQKIDIWSIGAVCYEMLIGKAVFDAKSLNDLVKKVEAGSYVVPTTLSKEIVSFLNSMLQYKSENRLSAAELSQHPFLTKNIKDFQKIDTKKVSRKIDYKGLNINIKNNQTIWSIFNEDDEQILLSIKGGNENPFIRSYSSNPNVSSSNASNFSLISNNSNISNDHFVPRVDTYNNFIPNSGQIKGNSPYGQNINIHSESNNNIPQMQNYGINQNIGMQPMQPPMPNNNFIYYNNPSQFTFNGMNNNYSNNNMSHQNQGNIGNYGGNNIYNNNIYNNNNNQNKFRPMNNNNNSGVNNICIII